MSAPERRARTALRVSWIAGTFFVIQLFLVWASPRGPFVDEGLYTVAGLRVLEGKGLSDGYIRWFNGSPFVWPVLAGIGYLLGGLEGARFMAVVLSTLALLALAGAAGEIFGDELSGWCALALAANGLFLALAHFAVYDVPALTGLAVSIWCASRSGDGVTKWIVGSAAAFAAAVIAKYGYLAMLVPLVGLLLSVTASARAVGLFLSTVAIVVGAYFLVSFGTLFPPSSEAYLQQVFGRSRSHIAALQLVFGAVPLGLAVAGAIIAWRRRGERAIVAACLLALFVYPAFHLWTTNFVSGQKHVVAGFLFGSLPAGLALERLWTAGSRLFAVAGLALFLSWGALQCYWQDRSWADIRPLADYLVDHVAYGDRVLAESSWNYALYLYPVSRVASPFDVIDANHSAAHDLLEGCTMGWAVGNPDSSPTLRSAVERCRLQPVLYAPTFQYYIDTAGLRLTVSSVVVTLYRGP